MRLIVKNESWREMMTYSTTAKIHKMILNNAFMKFICFNIFLERLTKNDQYLGTNALNQKITSDSCSTPKTTPRNEFTEKLQGGRGVQTVK